MWIGGISGFFKVAILNVSMGGISGFFNVAILNVLMGGINGFFKVAILNMCMDYWAVQGGNHKCLDGRD